MRQVQYKKRQSLKKRRKVISILESSQEKDYTTKVRKNFIYVVRMKDEIDTTSIKEPEIYITKYIDTKKCQEKFLFHVKGTFYMVQDDCIFRVDFRHSLNICIDWKTKKFSPKKSVTLT